MNYPIVNRTVPIVIKPKPGESALSFMTRTATANMYAKMRWLLEKRRLPRWDIGSWPDDVRLALAGLVGLDLETFDALAYRPHLDEGRLDSQRKFLGSRVPFVLINVEKRRYCPCCLEEDGFHHSFFDLTAVSICPKHLVRLHEACPICAQPQRWGGPSITACHRCSADLRLAEKAPVSRAEAEGTAAIARRVGFPVAEDLGTEWHPEVQHLTLTDAIELLSILDRLSADSQSRFPHFDPVDAHRCLQRGYEALVDWPNRFFARLDAIAANTPADPDTNRSRHKLFGFARVYGGFYSQIAQAQDEPWLFLRDAFAKYAGIQKLTPIVGRGDGAVYTADDVKDRPLITPKEAEAIVGKKYYAIRKLMASGAISPAVAVGGSRNRVFLDREQLEQISEGGAPLIQKEAAKRLGFPIDKLKQLMDDNIVMPLASPQHSGNASYLFAVREIDGLIERVRARVTPSDEFAANRPMKTLLRGQETLRTSSKPIFVAIESGELPVRGWDETRPGLAGALFNNREVDRFNQLIHDRERGDIEGLTTLRVSYILRCSPSTAAWMLEVGILEKGPSWTEKRPRTLRASLEKYMRVRTTAAAIAREWRTNGTIIANALAAAGIHPIREVNCESGVLIYERADVDRVDLKSKILEVSRKAGRTPAEYKALWKATK
jgi:hypothetical protein